MIKLTGAALAPLALALVLPATPALAGGARHAAASAAAISYERDLAEQESDLIMTRPIAGRENNYWFDYVSDVVEARQELRKDLKDASDSEDRADAFEEYRTELADARGDYVKEMKEKGYRPGRVWVEGD